MAIARRNSEWDHTAMLASMIHNILAKRPKGPSAFHPAHAAQRRTSRTEGGILGNLEALYRLADPSPEARNE